MSSSRVNGIILSSIPLNRKMKRYWISKYERIALNCGNDEAVRKFKGLRTSILSYLSDPNRRSNLDTYLSSTGFRKNGYLRMLFEYAETQPHFVLSFLKLYSCTTRGSQTTDDAACATHRRLRSVKANETVPSYLREWVTCLLCRPATSWSYVQKGNPMYPLKRTCGTGTQGFRNWVRYWGHWYRVVRLGWKSDLPADYKSEKQVFPEVYKDYDQEDQSSSAYSADFADLVSLHQSEASPLTGDQLEFIDGFLSEEIGDELYSVLWGESPSFSGLFRETSILSGMFVGHVHHIHKKGGGTELRDIAVPNRFIQAALVPCSARLYNLVRVLPHDATFDQSKFDVRIQNRVNNSNLFQGSVDLSKATDNLPLTWGQEVVDRLQDHFCSPEEILLREIFEGKQLRETEEEVAKSLDLFYTVARANWEDEGFFQKWEVGQPLGSLPSFAMLSITHNFLVESLAASLGLVHSPYFILGDDIVITNKKLRSRYIRELTSRAIPLSLHKSYEGRLSEFAGKTYVKNCVPFYCSDHNPVTWNSLLDWQRTTGIRIPWNNLPRSIQRKIESLIRQELKDGADEHPLTQKLVVELARDSYLLALTCEVPGRGSHIYPIQDSASLANRIAGYFEYRITDEVQPDAIKHTGITIIGDGHPVVLMGDRFADKDGYFQRFRPVRLPDWYKAKVRPCTTDSVMRAAIRSISENS